MGVEKYTVKGMERQGAGTQDGEKGRDLGRDGRARRRKEEERREECRD